MAERRYDADPGPVTGKRTARTRYSLNRYMPHIRGRRFRPNQKGGYGLAIWPEDRRPQLDLWIAHTRGERMDEVYMEPDLGLEMRNGAAVLVYKAGTRRSWQ
jgi:hypothetical protein